MASLGKHKCQLVSSKHCPVMRILTGTCPLYESFKDYQYEFSATKLPFFYLFVFRLKEW